MNKLKTFFDRNNENLQEDVEHRDVTIHGETEMTGRRRLDGAATIEIDRIEADPQHREHFDEDSLSRLAGSIREHGQLQPIKVRYDEQRSRYIVIAGERRLRACRLAELDSIDCVIADGPLTGQQILTEQIIENALREDLRPTEQARAFHTLMEAENWNGKQLAEQLHISPPTVTRALQLLRLPEDIQHQVDEGQIAITAALKTLQKSQGKPTISKPKKKPPKSAREKKLMVEGCTVIVKSRKILTDQLILAALNRAAAQIPRTEPPEAKAA